MPNHDEQHLPPAHRGGDPRGRCFRTHGAHVRRPKRGAARERGIVPASRQRADLAPRCQERGTLRAMSHYGKFRGVVVDNVDPEAIGRVKVAVRAVLGETSAWAMPCVPYTPMPPSDLMLPEIGTQVWVEFENGNPSYPIWSGRFWTKPEI